MLVAMLLTACGGGSKNTRPSSRGSSGGGSSSSSRGGYDDIRKSQGSRYRSSSDSVPTDIPDVSKLPEPVPKVEPRSLYGNKSPYSVLGQTYNVLPSPRGYVERGIASFYGNKFHGYKTSSLEEYDMYQFSGAHKTLPLPSYARVTNLENGKSVVVRINDRGPFHENRIIDLSFAAAVKIGVWPKGTGLVEVRAIDPTEANSDRGAPYVNTAPKPAPITAPPPPTRVAAGAAGAAFAGGSSNAVAAAPIGARNAPTPERALASRPPSQDIEAPVGAARPVGTSPAAGGRLVGATPVGDPTSRVTTPVGASPAGDPTSRVTTLVGASPAGDPRSRQAPIASRAGSSQGGSVAAADDEGHVPGMTGVSPSDALPPLAGAGTGVASAGAAGGNAAPRSTPTPAPGPSQGPVTPSVPGKPTIYLQVGAFSDAANANRVADQLKKAGLGPISVIETPVAGRNVRRVRVGPLADVDTADRVTDQIAGMGLPRPSVAVD
jgi:rare lipoprotein A